MYPTKNNLPAQRTIPVDSIQAVTPLFNLDLEAAVLGAIMSESDAALVAGSVLRNNAQIFHLKRHQQVFEAITALSTAGLGIDILTVCQQLRKTGHLDTVGGPGWVADLTTRINSAANFNAHCLFLIELYTKRKMVQMGHGLTQFGSDATVDAHEVLAEAQTQLNDLHGALQMRKPQKVAESYNRVVDKIVTAAKNKTGITGIPTGLMALDRITGGWQPGNLVIIAARPGMGKTSLMLAAAQNAATVGRPGLFISLEMSTDELITKMIATDLGYTTSQLTKGVGMSEDEAESIRQRGIKVMESKIIFDDTPGLGINELRAKAAKAQQEHGIEWLMVDYLQLMRGDDGGNREQEIGSISRGLKLLAKSLNIPVIAAAQLSRAVETRGGDCIPKLSDLRESGSIEMDADLVIFPYRPEYYKILQDEDGNSTADISQLIVAKHRNGAVDTAVVKSVMMYGRYSDIQENQNFEAAAPVFRSPLPMSNFDDSNESHF